MASSGSLDVNLESSVKAGDFAEDIEIICVVKFIDSVAVGLPYLGIDGACFVLKSNRIILFAVLGSCDELVFAHVDVSNSVACLQILNKLH